MFCRFARPNNYTNENEHEYLFQLEYFLVKRKHLNNIFYPLEQLIHGNTNKYNGNNM